MKKSTILFLSANLVILMIPVLFIGALCYKIVTKDFVDLIAQEEARYVKKKLPYIDAITLNGVEANANIEVVLNDSLNMFSTDTSTNKYVSYKIVGSTIIIDYDFVKDSIDNYIDDASGNGYRYSNRYDTYNEYSEEVTAGDGRVVRVYLTNGLKTANLNGTMMNLRLSALVRQFNDLTLFCNNADVTLHNPMPVDSLDPGFGKPEFYNEGDSKYLYNTYSVSGFKFDHSVKAQLYNSSSLNIPFAYVKKLDLDIKNSYSPFEFGNGEFGHLNLKIDKDSKFGIDVNDLHKCVIKYQ